MGELYLSDLRCDWHGCHLLPFVEVYSGKDWSYLCFFHAIKAWVRGDRHGWCIAAWISDLPFMHRLWNWWVR